MKNVRIDMSICMKMLFLLFFPVCLGSMVARADDLIVLKGSSTSVSVDGIRKISVANPAVIDARPSSRRPVGLGQRFG